MSRTAWARARVSPSSWWAKDWSQKEKTVDKSQGGFPRAGLEEDMFPLVGQVAFEVSYVLPRRVAYVRHGSDSDNTVLAGSCLYFAVLFIHLLFYTLPTSLHFLSPWGFLIHCEASIQVNKWIKSCCIWISGWTILLKYNHGLLRFSVFLFFICLLWFIFSRSHRKRDSGCTKPRTLKWYSGEHLLLCRLF